MRKLIYLLIFIMFIPSISHAQEIRILILDKRFPILPDEDKGLKKIGNINGELLLKGVAYRGKIEVWKGNKGLYIINQLPLEEYVKNVVYSETTEDWAYEALKVQAVIARTYAVKQMLRNRGKLYHLTSSTIHQLYYGDYRDERIEKAVEETKGQILTYKGEPIEALYHSTCGGKTEYAEEVFSQKIAYLRPVKNDCSLSPYWRWRKRHSLREIQKALKIKNIKDIQIASHTKSGRVKELKIITDKKVLYMLAKDFRRSLGWKAIPSTWFEIKRVKDVFVFDGRGYGHGVGLCQWGAEEMAEQGFDYKYILNYYYPDTKLIVYNED